MRKLAIICILAVLATCYAAPDAWAAGKPLERYTILVIRKFAVAPDLVAKDGFPEGYEDVLQKTLLARLLTESIFPQVIEGSENTGSPTQQVVVMEGQVTEFAKGSRAARVAVGYGAGSAKVKVALIFRDMATQEEVLRLEQTGRYVGFGNVTGGSADTARNESARKLIDGLVKQIKSAH